MNPKEFNKFILFTSYGEGLSLAKHLLDEGKEVLVGMVDDLETVGAKEPEDSSAYRARWRQYNGLLDKQKAESLIEKMKNFKDKDEWFVLFDFNNLWQFAEEALKAGFSKGLFPSRLDYKLESDRELAKKFVLKNYPDLKVAEVQEFKTAEEGVDFLKESEEFWALKGNDAGATTVVPSTHINEFATEELANALMGNKESYESKGFILERQIRDGTEVCPQLISYDGMPVATCIDLEDKGFSDTEGSEKYGCSQNCVAATPMDCELNKIAFPEVVNKMAKKHKGLHFWDANLICKDGEYYYLEFCANRMGFDSIFAECEMAGGVSNYFNALSQAKVPYEAKYGAGVRGFSMKRDDQGAIQKDIPLLFDEEIKSHLWFYGVQQKDGKLVNTGASYGDNIAGIDLVGFTESSDDNEYAWHKLKEVIEKFSFNGLYIRSFNDYHALDERLEKLETVLEPSEVAEGEE